MRPLPRKAGKEETLKKFFVWFLIPSVFLIDRLIKFWVLQELTFDSVPVWPGVFHLTLVHNTGAAFGLLRGGSQLLSVFSAVSVVLILVFLFRSGSRASHPAAWALVAGGALGNLYDRLAYGHVIDYLDFRVWPVFNFADACITVGVAWIFFGFFRKPGDTPHASGSL